MSNSCFHLERSLKRRSHHLITNPSVQSTEVHKFELFCLYPPYVQLIRKRVSGNPMAGSGLDLHAPGEIL